MRVGLSMREVSNLHHQTGCMLRGPKGLGGERCNRCVCKSRTYRQSGYEVSIIVTDVKRNDAHDCFDRANIR